MNQGTVRTSKKAHKTKQRILTCALDLFKSEGYYNVSVDQIIEKAHSSKGAFYNHFASKDELMLSYQEGWDQLYIEYYENVLQNENYQGKNALDKIKDMFCFILEMLTSQGEEVARVSTAYLLKDFKAGERNTDRNRKYREILTLLIHEGKQSGVIRSDLEDEAILRYITILLRGVLNDWEINRGSYGINDYSGLLIDLLCGHIST